jgi:hypothetical protein
MLVVNMAIDFSDGSLDKERSIWLTKGLIEVHNVPHHLSVECNRVAHVILQREVSIMMVVFHSLAMDITCSGSGT